MYFEGTGEVGDGLIVDEQTVSVSRSHWLRTGVMEPVLRSEETWPDSK